MYDYIESERLIDEFIQTGPSKADVVVYAALTELGWPYAWGAVGKRLCTVANRKAYMKSARISAGDIELIKKRCPILSGKQTTCDGCPYFPNKIGVWLGDCQGFVKRIFGYVGITFQGGGCTSMWNNAKNWEARGTIDTMPKDKVCCVFSDVKGIKEHILIYDGRGNYIHDSGEVKKQTMSQYRKSTHWAIPKGLYEGGVSPVENTKPTLKRGSSGEYVKYLQTRLTLLCYDIGSYGADGKFGAKTESAVKAFQKDRGLTADGIVGKATWKEIDKDVGTARYTVTIKNLTLEKAEEIIAAYGGEKAAE